MNWIKFKDQLPPIDKTVFVLMGYIFRSGIYDGKDHGGTKYMIWGGGQVERIDNLIECDLYGESFWMENPELIESINKNIKEQFPDME